MAKRGGVCWASCSHQRLQFGRWPQILSQGLSALLAPAHSLLEEADGFFNVGLPFLWGGGGNGAPEAEDMLSVKGEWEGQEGRGVSEIWHGQASSGQDSPEPMMLGPWKALSSV